ncbi:hypothetical protein ACVW0Q_001095 [Thermostichus sp. MS-CIW-21]
MALLHNVLYRHLGEVPLVQMGSPPALGQAQV